MASSTVFTSNQSQVIRLPKAVAFSEDVREVDILKIGRGRLIVPQGKRWDDLFQNGPRASNDSCKSARAQRPRTVRLSDARFCSGTSCLSLQCIYRTHET